MKEIDIMNCQMCDLKTNKRYEFHDGSYAEECSCNWLSQRYNILDDGTKEFLEDEENVAYFVESTEDISEE